MFNELLSIVSNLVNSFLSFGLTLFFHALASYSMAGDTSNEGFMSLSPDGSTLTFMAYPYAVGTTSLTGTLQRVAVLVPIVLIFLFLTQP